MLQGQVEIGEDHAVGHQGDEVVDVWIGIDIVHPHPGGQLPQAARQGDQIGLERAPLPEVRPVAQVQAIGAGVLRDHQDLTHPGLDQALGLGQDLAQRAAHQVAPQTRDDAEGAAVVAPLRDLEIGKVAGGESHPLGRHQALEGVVGGGQLLVDRGHDRIQIVGAGDGQYPRMGLADQLRAGAQAAGDDHPSVFGQGLADGLQRFLHRRVDEATGVDDDQFGPVIARGDGVAFGPQAGEDVLRVHCRLGAAQADEADAGRTVG